MSSMPGQAFMFYQWVVGKFVVCRPFSEDGTPTSIDATVLTDRPLFGESDYNKQVTSGMVSRDGNEVTIDFENSPFEFRAEDMPGGDVLTVESFVVPQLGTGAGIDQEVLDEYLFNVFERATVLPLPENSNYRIKKLTFQFTSEVDRV